MVVAWNSELHTYPSNWPRTSRKKVTRANLSFSIRFRLHHGSWGAKRIPFSLSSIHHSMPKDALRDGKGGWGWSTEWVMTGSALESFYHVFYLTSSAEKEIICKNRSSFASSTLKLFLSSLRLTHQRCHVYYIDFDIIVQTFFRRRWCAFPHLHFPFKCFFLLKHFIIKTKSTAFLCAAICSRRNIFHRWELFACLQLKQKQKLQCHFWRQR